MKLKRVLFRERFDWKFVDPTCNCRKTTAYLEGWSGLIREDAADDAIVAGKAVEIDEAGEPVLRRLDFITSEVDRSTIMEAINSPTPTRGKLKVKFGDGSDD